MYAPSKRKASSYKLGSKRVKLATQDYVRRTIAKSGDSKWLSNRYSSLLSTYVDLFDNLTTGGESNDRIANKIFLKGIHIRGAIYANTFNNEQAIRIMVVISKSGDLAGAGGSTDAPAFSAEANHYKYTVLHDKVYAMPNSSGDMNSIPLNIKCKTRTKVTFKEVANSSSLSCDHHPYVWFIPLAGSVITTQIYWGSQIYYNDV